MLFSCQPVGQQKISSSFRKRNQKRWWQVQQIINNSGFVSIKFNLFFSNINSYYQKFDLNVLFQSLFSFKTFLTKFSKQTLAVILLLQCNFFLVVGIRLSKLQLPRFYFSVIFSQQQGLTIWYDKFIFLIGFFRHGAGSTLKISQASLYLHLVYTNIPWDQMSKLYSEQGSCYMLTKYEEVV